jgi:hypothetical protein
VWDEKVYGGAAVKNGRLLSVLRGGYHLNSTPPPVSASSSSRALSRSGSLVHFVNSARASLVFIVLYLPTACGVLSHAPGCGGCVGRCPGVCSAPAALRPSLRRITPLRVCRRSAGTRVRALRIGVGCVVRSPRRERPPARPALARLYLLVVHQVEARRLDRPPPHG